MVKEFCCFSMYELRCKPSTADSRKHSMRHADKTSYNTFPIYIYFFTLSHVAAEVDTAKTCGLHSNACKGQLGGQLAHYSMSSPDRLETHKTNAAAHPKGHPWILMCNFNWTTRSILQGRGFPWGINMPAKLDTGHFVPMASFVRANGGKIAHWYLCSHPRQQSNCT